MNQEQIKAAREALDSLDDYARMNTGVDAIGPRGVLERFISEVERSTADVSALTDEQAWTIITEICGTQLTRVGSRKFQVVEINDMATAGEVARALLAAAPAPIQKEPSLAPDYSDMSREALERHAARMAQQLANDKARQFYDKYATGPMMTPSCLCCGKLPDKVAIKHAELPGIVVCEECRNAAVSQSQAAGDARNAALEEAAQLCNKHAQKQSSFHQYPEMYVSDYLARAIRGLKG